MRRRARWGRGLLPVVFVTAALPNSGTQAAVSLDWSEWHDHSGTPLMERRQYTSATNATTMSTPCLSDLVHGCSLDLELPGRQCGNDVTANDDFRVPFFYSRPSCGFEVGAHCRRNSSHILSTHDYSALYAPFGQCSRFDHYWCSARHRAGVIYQYSILFPYIFLMKNTFPVVLAVLFLTPAVQ